MSSLTLPQMLFLRDTVEVANKWHNRLKRFNSQPYKTESKRQEIYNEYVQAEINLDNLLESILM